MEMKETGWEFKHLSSKETIATKDYDCRWCYRPIRRGEICFVHTYILEGEKRLDRTHKKSPECSN